MLPTLLPHERRLFDTLAKNHTLQLRLRNNPLSCTCSGLDFVRWLALTVIRLDGHNDNTGNDDDYDDNGRDYPCMGEDGSMTSTGVVMADWDGHWRRCIGQTAFWAALVGLLLQLLGLVLTFVISRNWTYVRYAWRVLRHLQLPKRLDFRKDVLLGHADADLELAMRVRDCLRDEQGVRVLLPYEEILPGDIWTEKILQLVDDSWKILLLVTRELLQDRWAGFLVNHAQRSISDIMPDRVIVVFMEQPAHLAQGPPDHPARVSMERLLRMHVPQLEELDLSDNVLHLTHNAFRGLLNLTRLVLRHTGLNELPDVLLSRVPQLVTLDLGIWNCMTTVTGLTAIRSLDLSGNHCSYFDENIFRYMPTLRRLGLSNLRLDQDFIDENGTRLLGTLGLLEHLDMSANDLHRLPSDMLRAQPGLQSLMLQGNRFQELPTDLSLQTHLSVLDLSDNTLSTLLPHERRLLDTLAKNHTLQLRLRNNPLSCTCSGLDFVRWLALTVIRLDGHNDNTGNDDDYDDNGRDYPCMGEDGSMTSTGVVMADWDGHWRRCIGQTAFWAALVGLLLQLLGLVLTFVISRNWTYVRYAWRVLRHLQLPKRLDFRKDVLLGHADADLELAMRVRNCLRDEQGVSVLLPYEEILPGNIWTEKILQLVDDSWKILLLVTRELLQDRWAGFLVNHAQRSISDIMPDRVIVVFMEQPAHLSQGPPDHPARVSMERLLRMVPERNVFHVHRDIPPNHPVWDRLTELIKRQ
nr:hypothetical protein BaRGS_028151 [Batillaria attramentaria]